MNHSKRYALLSMGAASAAGFAVRGALRSAWRATTDRDPPQDPSSPGVEWREALLWALISAGFVALGRTIAQRAVGAGYRAVTGELPSLEGQWADRQ